MCKSVKMLPRKMQRKTNKTDEKKNSQKMKTLENKNIIKVK